MARPKKTAETAEIAAEEKQEQQEQGKTYTEAELNSMIAAAVAKAMAELQAKGAAAPQEKQKITLLWQAPVADDNVQEFGPNGRFGRIVGPSGTIIVNRDDFSQILDGMTRLFLDRRWLIVLDGLTDDEKDAYGVNYKEGEYLTREAFARLAEQGRKLLDIYPALCEGSRRIVACRVYEAWKNGSKSVTRDLVKDLNELCKAIDPEETTFKTILLEMNAADADDKE